MDPFTTSQTPTMGRSGRHLSVNALNRFVTQHRGQVQDANIALNAVMGFEVPDAKMICGVPFTMPKPTDSDIRIIFNDDSTPNKTCVTDEDRKHLRDGATAQDSNADKMDIEEPEQRANVQAGDLGLSAAISDVREVNKGFNKSRGDESMNQSSSHTVPESQPALGASDIGMPHARGRSLSDITPPEDTKARIVIDLCSPTPKPAAGRTRPPVLDLTGAAYGGYANASGVSAIKSPAPSPSEHKGQPSTAANRDPSSASQSSIPPPSRDYMALNKPHYWSEDLSNSLLLWHRHPKTSLVHVQVHKIRFCSQTHNQVNENSGLPTPPLDATGLYDAITHYTTSVEITRMLLPECARAPFGLPTFRDWIILTSNNEASPFAMVKDIDGRPVSDTAGQSTYWLCAFPVESIGTIRTGNMPERRDGQKVVATNLALNMEGKLPLMHGRNVTPWFLEHWLKACASGEATLQITSAEALPFHPLKFVGN